MTDIRLIGLIFLLIVLGLGLLIAKAFVFSAAWIWWPVGVMGACWAVVCFFLTMWSEH